MTQIVLQNTRTLLVKIGEELKKQTMLRECYYCVGAQEMLSLKGNINPTMR